MCTSRATHVESAHVIRIWIALVERDRMQVRLSVVIAPVAYRASRRKLTSLIALTVSLASSRADCIPLHPHVKTLSEEASCRRATSDGRVPLDRWLCSMHRTSPHRLCLPNIPKFRLRSVAHALPI